MRVLVLQHIVCEPPAEYEDVLRERGAEILRVELDEGEPLPDPGDFDAIVAMGGPMSANDDVDLPWLTQEKRLIGDCVRADMPYWGACLGVQLLAASLGAQVYPGPLPEVGLMNVDLAEAAIGDPVFRGLPPSLLTLQWHGDTFDLPEGSVRLAGSSAYPNQAFRWGDRAYGVQFHVEVTIDLARQWATVPAYGAYADRVLGPGALPRLLDEFGEHEGELRSHGRAMFSRWLDVATG